MSEVELAANTEQSNQKRYVEKCKKAIIALKTGSNMNARLIIILQMNYEFQIIKSLLITAEQKDIMKSNQGFERRSRPAEVGL